jgi:hypothetical protein
MSRDACAGWAILISVGGVLALAFVMHEEQERYLRLVGPRTGPSAGPGLVEENAGAVTLACAAVGGAAAFFAFHAWRPRTYRRTLGFTLVAVALAAAAGVPAVLRYREAEHNRAVVVTPDLPGAFKH